MPAGPAVHRRDDEHLGARIEVVVGRQALRRRARRPRRGWRRAPVRSMTKKSRRSPGAGHRRRRLAGVDRVRGADDERARGLAEDVGQAHDRHAARLDEVVEHAAGADRRELVDVADEQHVRARPDGGEQRLGQAHREHRGLVDDEHVGARDRVLGPAREALAGEYSSSRWMVVACAPVISASRRAALPVGAHRRTVRFSRVQEVDERAHRHRLAGARAAGEDRQPALEHGAHHRPLGVGGGQVAGRALDRAQPQARLVVDQRAHVARQPRLDARASTGRRHGRPRSRAGRGRRDRRCGRRRRRRAGGGRARPARRGEMAVAVVLGLVQRVAQPGIQAPGGVGGVPSAWASASAVAKPMPSSSVRP